MNFDKYLNGKYVAQTRLYLHLIEVLNRLISPTFIKCVHIYQLFFASVLRPILNGQS